jgi:hypothetical protein
MTTLLHHTRIGISIRLKDKVNLFWAEVPKTIQRNSVEVILEVLVIIIVAVATSSTTTRKESRLQALGQSWTLTRRMTSLGAYVTLCILHSNYTLE